MANQENVLPCPFCQGNGRLRRDEIEERLADPCLARSLRLALPEAGEAAPEAALAKTGEPDFQEQVRHWNPQRTLWRRSNKE